MRLFTTFAMRDPAADSCGAGTYVQVGVPNSLMKLAQHQLQSTLAVSLHAANQELRTQLIPRYFLRPLSTTKQGLSWY